MKMKPQRQQQRYSPPMQSNQSSSSCCTSGESSSIISQKTPPPDTVRRGYSSTNPAWDSVMKKFQKIKIKNQFREDPCELSNPVGVAVRFKSKKDFFCGTLINTYIMDQFEHMINLHLQMSHFDSIQSPEGVSMTLRNRSFTFCVFVIDGCMNVILFGKPMETASIIQAVASRNQSMMPNRHIFPDDLQHHQRQKSFSTATDNSSAILSPMSSSLFASSGPRNESSPRTRYSRQSRVPTIIANQLGNKINASTTPLLFAGSRSEERYKAGHFPISTTSAARTLTKNSKFTLANPDLQFIFNVPLGSTSKSKNKCSDEDSCCSCDF